MEQIMEKMVEVMLKDMDEKLNDSGRIASSAIALAVNRAHDLKINPIMTMVMLKYLVELNIELLLEETIKDKSHFSREFHERQLKTLKEMIEKACKNKTHTMTL